MSCRCQNYDPQTKTKETRVKLVLTISQPSCLNQQQHVSVAVNNLKISLHVSVVIVTFTVNFHARRTANRDLNSIRRIGHLFTFKIVQSVVSVVRAAILCVVGILRKVVGDPSKR